MGKITIDGKDFFAASFEEKGFLRRTGTGQVCVDQCASDEEHLLAPTPVEFDRRICRTLLSDLVPDEFLGRRGQVRVTVEFTAEESIASRE